VAADLATYRKLAGAGDERDFMKAFESTFFNNMVLVLDHYFVHRLRAVESMDGNALNEVRVLGDSMLCSNKKMVGYLDQAHPG
jgi:hypothetical protein